MLKKALCTALVVGMVGMYSIKEAWSYSRTIQSLEVIQELKVPRLVGVTNLSWSDFSGTPVIAGVNPELIIGDAGEEDTKLKFDGNAQDYHLGIDDTDDKFKMGLGSTLGTTPFFTADSSLDVVFPQRMIINGVQAADSAATNETLEIAFTSPVDTTGTNTHNAITIDLTIGNASGGTNVVNGLKIDAISGDAQVTENAINIGAGWVNGITCASGVLLSEVASADSATTNDTVEIAFTSPVDTTGTNTHNALTIDLGIGNATGGTNVVVGLQVDGISGDAQVTETAVNIGSGWDSGITCASPVTFSSTVIRTGVQYVQTVAYAKLGSSGSGWVIGAADSIQLATLPQSQTTENMVIPVTIPLKVGDTITAFSVIGQIESAGGTVTVDADLRKGTAAAGDHTDASVGTITQVSKTADYEINDAKTGLTEIVAANETFYVVILATTAGTTDIAISGITVTVTEN